MCSLQNCLNFAPEMADTLVGSAEGLIVKMFYQHPVHFWQHHCQGCQPTIIIVSVPTHHSEISHQTHILSYRTINLPNFFKHTKFSKILQASFNTFVFIKTNLLLKIETLGTFLKLWNV